MPRRFVRLFEMPRTRLSELSTLERIHQTEMSYSRYCSKRRKGCILAIITFPDPISGIDVQPLAREKFYLLAPAGMHPLPYGTCTTQQALGVPLILSHLPQRERCNIEALAKKSRITLDVRVEADTLSLMKSLAMLGYGSLLLPETAVLEEKNNPEWHATVLSDLTLTRYIARRVTPTPSNAGTCVYDILMEEIENLKSIGVMF